MPLFLPQHLPAKQTAGDVFPSGPPSSSHTTDDATNAKLIWKSRGADGKGQDFWTFKANTKAFLILRWTLKSSYCQFAYSGFIIGFQNGSMF